MAKVHEFSLITELHDDTRLPLQYLGNGQPNAARAFQLSVLLAWIEDNLSVLWPVTIQTVTINSGTSSIAVAAGYMVAKMLIIGSASGTVDVGTSAAGNDVLDGETYDTDGAAYAMDKYFNSSGTLHFSGYGSDTLTVKLMLVKWT